MRNDDCSSANTGKAPDMASMSPDVLPSCPVSSGYVGRRMERWRQGHGEQVEDCIAEEMPIAMQYNGVSFAVMMATPRDLEDFALGFSLSERLVAEPAQLESIEQAELLEGIRLSITVAPAAPAARLDGAIQRLLPGRGSCGICGARELEDAVRQPERIRQAATFRTTALERALAQLQARQPMNAATGAMHAAVWADAEGNVMLVREDVGRHNALDKLIGAMVRAGTAPGSGMLLLTSRASYEMVAKAACAGIGFMAAISAPTALAVELARSAGVCLVGFARPGSHNIYTHPERLVSG